MCQALLFPETMNARSKIQIMSVVGARPNFMKIAPLVEAIDAHNRSASSLGASPIEHRLVHTGQHYDKRMSKSFFEALSIPRPDIDLEIGSGTHAEQVGQTMIAFEKVVREWTPDWVVVVGDVNATCACSITAKKEHVKVAHIEAGLRSFDLEMPEEINRMVTDRLSDLLFTTDELADQNLRNEGVSEDRIQRVGNVMIDTLERHREAAARLSLSDVLVSNALLSDRAVPTVNGRFSVLTMHRPSNVDDPAILGPLVDLLIEEVAGDMPLVWPIHPRTRKNLNEFGLWERVQDCANIILLEPVGYVEMLHLNLNASMMLTDSGGLQEECCVLGTPCLTLRWNTERPVTLTEHGGASTLVGNDVDRIRAAYRQRRDEGRRMHRPDMWDGNSATRIVEILVATGDDRIQRR
jgi:UDP-N-acetylglucosamine 2-epimerase (non-hydrolysing)